MAIALNCGDFVHIRDVTKPLGVALFAVYACGYSVLERAAAAAAATASETLCSERMAERECALKFTFPTNRSTQTHSKLLSNFITCNHCSGERTKKHRYKEVHYFKRILHWFAFKNRRKSPTAAREEKNRNDELRNHHNTLIRWPFWNWTASDWFLWSI